MQKHTCTNTYIALRALQLEPYVVFIYINLDLFYFPGPLCYYGHIITFLKKPLQIIGGMQWVKTQIFQHCK